MLRTIALLTVSLGLACPLTAGEMDNETGAKKVQPPAAAASPSTAAAKVSELDQESPTQAWHRRCWGGWGWRSSFYSYPAYSWGGYYTPYYSYSPYYASYSPYYASPYASFSIGYYRPWGGVRVGFGW